MALLVALPQITFAQLPPTPEPSDPAARPEPKLFIAERLIELDPLLEGDVSTITWILENHGDADLVIEHAKATCGCTVVELTDKDRIIPAQGLIELRAEFDSRGRRGRQRQGVTITTNDPSEPKLKVEFVTQVESVYEVKPSGALQLRMVRRGEVADRSLQLTPATGRSTVEVIAIEIPSDAPLSYQTKPLKASKGGVEVWFKVTKEAPLGPIDTSVRVRLKVDDIERERVVRIRAEVVADLFWQPRVVDATRLRLVRGRNLTPIILRSTDKAPFEILSAQAGPLLDVSHRVIKGAPPHTKYEVVMSIREDAPSGPFAAVLRVHTSLFDQPVVTIPVYGNITPWIAVDPPVIVLRQDGTSIGTRRRIKVQASIDHTLVLKSARCTNESVAVAIDAVAGERYRHIRFLEVSISKDLPAGSYEATLTLTTNVDQRHTIEIPVRIEVPK